MVAWCLFCLLLRHTIQKIILYLFHSFQLYAIFPLFFPLSSDKCEGIGCHCANDVSLNLFFSLVICKCHSFRNYSLNFPEHFILNSEQFKIHHLYSFVWTIFFFSFYLPKSGHNCTTIYIYTLHCS